MVPRRGDATGAPQVRVDCVVTLKTSRGFYCQDAAALWSGIFVHAGSSAPYLRGLGPGDRVEVDGYVDEHLGQTQIEVEADREWTDTTQDRVRVVATGVAVEPLDVDTGVLGGYAQACDQGAEAYEGVLVRVGASTLQGGADDFGRVGLDDGSGLTHVDSSGGFDTAA